MLKYLMIIFQFLWSLKELDINKDNFLFIKLKQMIEIIYTHIIYIHIYQILFGLEL